ncbi:MAG: recombinase family protein [Muribaculaceae bacterium]|nr:recombinase family protein [Muribaculaceae bacterium]
MKSKQTQLNRVGLYMRLSQEDDRENESLSIENQRLILQKYVSDRGWKIIDEYVDDGVSGTTFEREGVQRLLEDAKNGIIDTIIVKDLSRFGRNYILVGQYLDYIFPLYNIRFIALNDNVDTADKNSTGMDMMPIMNVFNEWHSANTSKKIRAVFVAKAKAGQFKATYIPYGYIKGTDGVPLIVDEETAPIVRRIFEMRASGMGKQHIATVLTKSGIPTPSERRNKRFGVAPVNKNRHGWCSQSVKEMLLNPVYIGNLAQQRTTTVSYKNKRLVRRPENEWIIVEGTHEPIISAELWAKCREIDASVSHGKSNKQGEVRPLSGLIYCPECCAKMRLMNYDVKKKGVSTGEKRAAYNCSEFLKHGKDNCNSKAIKETILNEIVLQDIRSKAEFVLMDEQAAREDFLKRKALYLTQQINSDEKKQRAKEKRIQELSGLMQSIYEDKVLKRIPEAICVELLQKYQDEKSLLQEELAEIANNVSEANRVTADVEEFIRRIRKYVDLTELDRTTAMELIEYITIGRVPKDKTTP